MNTKIRYCFNGKKSAQTMSVVVNGTIPYSGRTAIMEHFCFHLERKPYFVPEMVGLPAFNSRVKEDHYEPYRSGDLKPWCLDNADNPDGIFSVYDGYIKDADGRFTWARLDDIELTSDEPTVDLHWYDVYGKFCSGWKKKVRDAIGDEPMSLREQRALLNSLVTAM